MKTNIAKQHSTAVETFRNQRPPWPRLSVRLIPGLLGTMSLMFPGVRFASAQDLSPAIRVRVDNYTPASPALIATTEREASRILGAAGLRTVWLNCPASHSPDLPRDPCQDPLETTDIVLRVVSESTQNKFQDTVFGFAIQPVLATVYFEYPEHLAKSNNADFELPVILGCVIAHEIGHLLLGPNSHSNSGIMQPRWGSKQMRQALTGCLLFTLVQAKHIQAEARIRMNSETAGLQSRVASPIAD